MLKKGIGPILKKRVYNTQQCVFTYG